MKAFYKIAIFCLLLVAASGCETYKDYEIEYSPVYPLCGEWLVRFTDTSVTPNVTSGLIVMSTFNTADNSTNQMWIRTTSTSSSYTGRFDGKISCDVPGKSFSGGNVQNTYYTTTPSPTFTITEGIIVMDGYDTATGGKSDKITFTMTDTRKAGKVYKVTGFRRTRWLDDEV
ncbi:MAG: hypothetical protein IPJ16_16145 [Bacteroidales bacterium]|nr:hypothetical protein [Bacteroidales bacterium]